MKLSLVPLMVLILATITTHAQYKDRVITNNNDTIACKLGHSFFSDKYSYTPAGDSTSIKIKLDSVREFYNGDKSLWVRRVYLGKNSAKFMTVLESGKLNLYEVVTTSTSNLMA